MLVERCELQLLKRLIQQGDGWYQKRDQHSADDQPQPSLGQYSTRPRRTRRYPAPRTVVKNRGDLGSGSILRRSLAM